MMPIMGLTLLTLCAGVEGAPTPQRANAASATVTVESSARGGPRYKVVVANVGTDGDIVSVILGHDFGFTEQPSGIGRPKGWHHRTVKQELPGGGARWQLWLSCDRSLIDPAEAADSSGQASGASSTSCDGRSIRPGQRQTFTLGLLHWGAGRLTRDSVQLVFAGGQATVASE
jgi:hypothetical protein